MAGLTLVVLLVAGGCAAPRESLAPTPVLRVVSQAGEELLRLPLTDEPTWVVEWQHSVAGVLVQDRFALRDGQMVLVESTTPLLDIAGLGHTPGRGDLEGDGQGGHRITNINATIPGNGYWMRIGSARAPTTIIYRDERHPLSNEYPSVRARIEVVTP